MIDANAVPTVFVSYVSSDFSKAHEIAQYLRTNGIAAWLDKEELVLGDNWESEIKNAVASADAFIVCLRPGFDDIGFRQKEIRWALEALQLRPPDRGFIIPFVLEPCELPQWCRQFHAGDLSKPSTLPELLIAVKKHCKIESRLKQTDVLIEERSNFRAGFSAQYAKQLSYAIAAVEAMSQKPSREAIIQVMVQTLRVIQGVMLAYHHRDRPQINVNVMIAYTQHNLPAELAAKIRFNYGDNIRYSHYLALAACADSINGYDFVLPVENLQDARSLKLSLPGAPLAFLTRSAQVIDDTSRIEYSHSLPAVLKKQLKQYFNGQFFKSFACIPIMGPNAKQFGVLVIESAKSFVFGRTQESKSEIHQLISPFSLLLGNLISKSTWIYK